MSLRPFVFVTACLLGACERKSVSTDAALPDHAETRSSLRDDERRPVVTRREREGKVDAVEVIRRLAGQGNNPGNLYNEAHLAIEEADPSEFEAIWRALDEVKTDVVDKLQVRAIYRLAAKGDLAVAGRIAREIMLPRYPEEQRLEVLKELMRLGEDGEKIASFLEFMRDASPEEREGLEESITIGWLSLDDLSQLVASDHRLDAVDTRMILKRFEIPPFGEPPFHPTSPEGKVIFREVWETIKTGEQSGVFVPGAGDQFLNIIGRFQGDVYLELVPRDRLAGMLREADSEDLIESVIVHDMSRAFVGGNTSELELESPDTFFSSTGVHYLPEDKTSVAIITWHGFRPAEAEAWFTNHRERLTVSQRDATLIGFVKSARWTSAGKAQEWLDQISDPELRERFK